MISRRYLIYISEESNKTYSFSRLGSFLFLRSNQPLFRTKRVLNKRQFQCNQSPLKRDFTGTINKLKKTVLKSIIQKKIRIFVLTLTRINIQSNSIIISL